MNRLTEPRRARRAVETYVLRVAAGDAPGVSRTFEVRAQSTLADLHQVIQDEFDLPREGRYSFQVAHPGDTAGAGRQIGGEHAAQHHLCDLLPAPGVRFTYTHSVVPPYDIELLSVGALDSALSYPRRVASQGEAPAPSGDGGDEGDGAEAPPLPPELQALVAPLAQAMEELEERMEIIDELWGDDDDEADPAGARADGARDGDGADEREEDLLVDLQAGRKEALALADQLLTLLPERLAHLPVLEMECGGSVEDWLDDLCQEPPPGEPNDEGLALAYRTARVLDPLRFRQTAAYVLARAGRHDEALVEIESVLAEQPAALEVMLSAADIFEMCGQTARAEEQVRRALAHPEIEQETHLKLNALDQLIGILRQTGRAGEAQAREAEAAALAAVLEEEEFEDDEDLDGEDGEDGEELWSAPPGARGEGAPLVPLTPVLPFRREAPKIGRNEPCPCGSGKKYKKCCGLN